jgi:hypothetical protein
VKAGCPLLSRTGTGTPCSRGRSGRRASGCARARRWPGPGARGESASARRRGRGTPRGCPGCERLARSGERVPHLQEGELPEVRIRGLEPLDAVLAKQRGQVRVGNEIAADGERAAHLAVDLQKAFRFGEHPHPRQAQERLQIAQGFRRRVRLREDTGMGEWVTTRRCGGWRRPLLCRTGPREPASTGRSIPVAVSRPGLSAGTTLPPGAQRRSGPWSGLPAPEEPELHSGCEHRYPMWCVA